MLIYLVGPAREGVHSEKIVNAYFKALQDQGLAKIRRIDTVPCYGILNSDDMLHQKVIEYLKNKDCYLPTHVLEIELYEQNLLKIIEESFCPEYNFKLFTDSQSAARE